MGKPGERGCLLIEAFVRPGDIFVFLPDKSNF